MGKTLKIRLVLINAHIALLSLGVIRREEGQIQTVIIPMCHIMDTIELIISGPGWYALRTNGLQILPGIGGYRCIFIRYSGQGGVLVIGKNENLAKTRYDKNTLGDGADIAENKFAPGILQHAP